MNASGMPTRKDEHGKPHCVSCVSELYTCINMFVFTQKFYVFTYSLQSVGGLVDVVIPLLRFLWM
jgi:hypothetical protein